MDDEEMAKYPGLVQRNGDGMLQVRKRIRVDLRHVDKLVSIRESLRTKDKREAIGLYHLKMAAIEAGFDAKRAELRNRPLVQIAIAEGRIENLGYSALEGLVRQWWQQRGEYRQPSWTSEHALSEAMASLDDDLALTARAEKEGRDLAGEIADRLLVDAGFASSSH